MRIFLGLGSNVGDRIAHLQAALGRLQSLLKPQSLKVSPVYETRALLPEGAPEFWNQPFLNLVAELESPIEAGHLLSVALEIENLGGRDRQGRWSPRPIDIDVLLYGNQTLQDAKLTVPHPEIHRRAFVLDPLKDLSSGFVAAARLHPDHQPVMMGILNLTPDSFSDGGRWDHLAVLENEIALWDLANVAYIDLGAESTRPNAEPISHFEEWLRLRPALELLRRKFKDRLIKPRISVDTRHFHTAVQAIEFGADVINDVSGLADPRFAELIRDSRREYVLMHSLSVPADPATTWNPDTDVMQELKPWFETKVQQLLNTGVKRDQIILDPGIGFGKTASQSRQIVDRIEELHDLNFRILVGHSRKSFLAPSLPAVERDNLSVEMSKQLKKKGVDILRVHNPLKHIEALNA